MNLFILTASHLSSKYLIVILLMFLIGAMLGYLSESLFRRFVSAKKWVNPGFMRGPWLPLYGFGLVAMFLICQAIIYFLPTSMPLYNPQGNLYNNTIKMGPTINDLIPIFIMFIVLLLLEFIGGLIFVKGFKMRLWDYTNMKGNILGIICPQFSIIWFLVAIIYYYALNPYVFLMFENLFTFMFGSQMVPEVNILFLFFLGIIYGIFLIDLIISLNIFNKLLTIAKESEGLKHYEKFRDEQKAKLLANKAKLLALIPEDIKNKYEESKIKRQANNNKFKTFIAKLIYIDPNKTTKDNYDSSGRPKKED